MALGARLVTRRLCLMAGISAPLGWSLAAPRLLIRRDGANLRVSAPQIRFLNGKALDRLKNGANVGFVSQILVTVESNAILLRHVDRFVVSYDLWEEKFSATRLGPPQRTASRMSVPATEAWCLDALAPIPPVLAPSRLFWLKLELRVEDPKESTAIVGDPGINLTNLVELFSRPPGSQQQHWNENAGPLRLQDL